MTDWFEDGLAFECTRCGKCCTGAIGSGGAIRITEAEEARLAARLELEPEAFRGIYTRALGGGAVSLRERPNGDCVFYDPDAGCTVYSDRPRQCRTWPFWRGTLATPAHWRAAAEKCPGVDRGQRRTANEIRASRDDDGTSGMIPRLD